MTSRRSLACIVLLGATTLAVMHATSTAAQPAAQPIEATLRCSAYAGPRPMPAYEQVLAFERRGDALTFERATRARPGKETFKLKVTQSGNVELRGDGRFDGSIPWRYRFDAARPDAGGTVLTGSMLQEARGTIRPVRTCSVTFTSTPVELAQQIRGVPASTVATAPVAPAARPDDVARLQRGQQALGTQLARTDDRVADVERQVAGVVLPATEMLRDWTLRATAIPAQQQQFCRIVDRFYDDLRAAYRGRNEIARNALYQDRRRDFRALLPNGEFANWVMRLVEVRQTADGSAVATFQPPCRILIGSDVCSSRETETIALAIPAGTLQFRELERLRNGDFVLVSGQLPYAAGGVADSLPKGTTAMCRVQAEEGLEGLVADVRYLVRMQ